jgi:hypothetical protein
MCLLNSKTLFDIPNVPAYATLLRFNILFSFIFEAVSGGKGIMQLKIDASKNQTITNLMIETFPAIQCYDNKELPFITPKTVTYIQALTIDSISILFEDSINAQALDLESAMVDSYTKMKPDSFKSQLQAALTTYYKDIKGFWAPALAPRPRSSSADSRTKRMPTRTTRAWPPLPPPLPSRPKPRQRLQPPPAGRRLHLLRLPPALPERGRDGLPRLRRLSQLN